MAPRKQQRGGSEQVAFHVLPAVDLLGREAVRLERGAFDRVALRAGDPEALVARFAAARPALIHVVDLEGARSGRVRPGVVAQLVAAAAGVPVQASGGIRSLADAEALFAAGAARVVVGTAAFSEPGALERYVSAFGDRLVIAVDAKGGQVAIAGWERTAGVSAEEAAERCAAAGAARLLCTAVERDGTMSGPDLELLGRVQRQAGLPVLAAGGIRSERDLADLARLGLEGAIVGRALLEGRIPLSMLRADSG
jgi:phosphoribosylformimino-5-aminoimidazole carboxamide ribotide isomerase